MSPSLAKVNRTKMPVDLLAAMLERHADMDEDRRGMFEARGFELVGLLKAKGYKGIRQTNMALALTVNQLVPILADLTSITIASD